MLREVGQLDRAAYPCAAPPPPQAGACPVRLARREMPAGRREVAAGTKELPTGVDKTSVGVSKTLLGVNKTSVGVSKTLLSVSKTSVSVSKMSVVVNKTLLGVDNTLLGVGKTLVGLSKTLVGRSKSSYVAGNGLFLPEATCEPARETWRKGPDRSNSGIFLALPLPGTPYVHGRPIRPRSPLWSGTIAQLNSGTCLAAPDKRSDF